MKKLILLLISLSIISCNNWDENPSKAKVIEESDNTITSLQGLAFPQTFPPLLTTMHEIKEGSITICLTGTEDRMIYSTSGYPLHNSIPSLILPEGDCVQRFFSYYGQYPVSGLNIYAGTRKGIYYSNSKGAGWTRIITKSEKTNQDISVVAFERTNEESDPNKHTLNAYGWDGKYNKFSSTDYGATWNYSTIQKGPIIAETSYDQLTQSGLGQVLKKIHVFASQDESSTCIITNSLGSSAALSTGISINSLASDGSSKCYAATSDGIYSASNTFEWQKTGLKGYNVLTIVASSDGAIFAGTTRGGFYSPDFGISWRKLRYVSEDSTVRLFKPYEGYIVIQDAQNAFHGCYDKTGDLFLFKPMPVSPENQSSISESDVTFKWVIPGNNSNASYALQFGDVPNFMSNSSFTMLLPTFGRTRFEFGGMPKGKKYYWRIRAYIITGATDWSDTFSFTIK